MLPMRRTKIVKNSTLAAFGLLLLAPPGATFGEDTAPKAAVQEEVKSGAPKEEKAAQGAAAKKEESSAGAAAPHLMKVKAEPFAEATAVRGELKNDLEGVWLLVTNAELAPGKFKTFPQLVKVTKGESGPEFHLLDVVLPEAVRSAVTEANRTLAGWTPSPEVRETFAKSWSKFPKAEEKSISDPPYGGIRYTLVAQDQIDSVFPTSNPLLQKALEGSVFGMEIVESYKPIPTQGENQVSQLMQRKTIYGAKSAADGVVSGSSMVGFIASGAGSPIPLQFGGSFTMYRLGEAS